MSSLRARTSALAASALVGALATAVPAMTATAATPTPTPTSTTSPASGPIDCPSAYPLSQVTDGIKGIGWTVAKGSTPERFDADVLGVLKDGVGYGMDIVLAEVSSPALTRAGGVWAGMSGSPVYAPDGRLIGAVAYTLSNGSSFIAGLTPAESMLPLTTVSAAPKAKVAPKATAKLDSAMTSRLQREGVSPQASAGGLKRLAVPVWVSGTSGGKFQQKLVDKLASHGLEAKVGGSSSSSSSAPATGIHAGGNFAAAVSTGALTLGGVGTTTAVCNGRAVAFGHPMTGAGPVSLPALSADVVTVIPDILSPFKAANFGGVVGTLDKDTTIGIAATLGTAPTKSTTVISNVTAPDGTVRKMESKVYDVMYGSNVAANQIYSAGIKALGGDAPGSAVLQLGITGKRADGTAFSWNRTDRLSAAAGLSLPYALGDQVYGLSGALLDQDFEDITVTKVTMNVKLSAAPNGLRFSQLSYKKGSTWVTLNGSKTPAIDPGVLTLRTTLVPQKGVAGSPVTKELPVTIPADLAGDLLDITVEGGVDPYMVDVDASTFAELLKALKALPATNAVKVTVFSESLDKPIVTTVPVDGTVVPFSTWTSFTVNGGDVEPEPEG